MKNTDKKSLEACKKYCTGLHDTRFKLKNSHISIKEKIKIS